MIKIRLFFLSTLLLLVPLIYAWFYIPFLPGTLANIVSSTIPEMRWAWFESVKVSLFLILTIGALVAFLTDYVTQKKHPLSEFFVIGILSFFVWTSVSYVLNRNINPYFWTGNAEKTHGLIFYFGLFCFFWLLRSLSIVHQKRLLQISFLGFLGVVLYAFFQRFGLDPLTNAYNSRLDPWRIFATLGNPNYLAGYVLIILPLLRVYRFQGELSWEEHLWEIGVWFVSGLLIYWTGSYLAWIVFTLYVGYVILDHVLPKNKQRPWLWTAITLFLFFSTIYICIEYRADILETEKMKGFIARWYLWKTGFAAITHDFGHFLFGYGPDGFLSVSESFRHPLLSIYEDPAYRIDRSHNVFIDFAIHFWVPLTLATLYGFAVLFRWLTHEKKVAICIFAVYFSFNIPVLVHFLILTQILASAKKLA